MLNTFDASSLVRVPLFAQLGPEDLAAVAGSFQTQLYKKHAVLFHEGDAADSLFIVMSGCIAVTSVSAEGKEAILSILKEGDVVGEMGIIDAAPRSATVKALCDTRVALLGRDAFLELLDKHPMLNRAVISGLTKRLRATNQAVSAASYLQIKARLADALLMLEKNFGERFEGGSRITIRLTNQQMANMVGTSRETLNRTLNLFWDEKLIDMGSRDIVIPDLSKLAAMVA
jgi:CRP-like cAMP-binding protein